MWIFDAGTYVELSIRSLYGSGRVVAKSPSFDEAIKVYLRVYRIDTVQ